MLFLFFYGNILVINKKISYSTFTLFVEASQHLNYFAMSKFGNAPCCYLFHLNPTDKSILEMLSKLFLSRLIVLLLLPSSNLYWLSVPSL